MNLEPIFNAGFPIKVHVAAAILSAIFGATIFLNRKGTGFHKTFGWSFVVLMTITAVSAVFIRRTEGIPNIAGFTPIHLFVVLTALTLPRALLRIRRGDVPGHAASMIGLFIGAILIAGALAFLPGRILNRVFFGG